MKHRFAFAGFRHLHILSLWNLVEKHPDCQIVAAYEGDTATREQLAAEGKIEISHRNYASMLRESGCTVVAIGDVYALRGALAIEALQAGLHVISDKPITTNLAEWEEIKRLALQRNLSVGCQLDLVENKAMRRLRSALRAEMIGEVCTINIAAQHPLRLGTRAPWYFQPGQHGGTINDIGIHIFDLVPWISATNWDRIIFAREWNAKAAGFPHFKDCAQFYGLLETGATCFADVSYLAPDTVGYELPHYWRITIHGTKGMAEASYGIPEIVLATDTDPRIQVIQASTDCPETCLDDFLAEITGLARSEGLTTHRVLSASKLALETQQLAHDS